ncbi:uncharacterized protein N7518_010268 [Penicillium psychrosexuale]|uniref:uncharacterized protein n=1 Tax=Penicillium psychrosexuale TaxID=1002107 RepID=UPI002545A5F0|nr:uncharacterized protein N7518_010268 [Penicillium psychrosexuale]KAJ5781785.1 hypothetical protein N7518_010268 [Penicillium psychrosexuale]
MGVRDPTLLPKRKRNHRRYRQKKAKKIKADAAAATQKNEVAEPADSSAIEKSSLCLISPFAAPSPAVTSPAKVTLPIRGLRNPYN